MGAVMLQGTGSDVGKSVLVAGLCRALVRRGLRVLPFKPQNMSNNAAVTSDGGEIGRAQALQAVACKVEPHTDMNPVLLKPQADRTSQLIVHGRVRGTIVTPELMIQKGVIFEGQCKMETGKPDNVTKLSPVSAPGGESKGPTP